MRIALNAGHTKIGSGVGASKYLVESVETRKIVGELISLLADTKHEVIPIIIDKSSNNLNKAVLQANNEKADLFISIHLNAGCGSGCEAYTYKGAKLTEATNILNNLSALGFKNRGIKDGSNLYVIKNTKMKAILIEVCFLDTLNDVALYKKVGVKKIAEAIKKGLS